MRRQSDHDGGKPGPFRRLQAKLPFLLSERERSPRSRLTLGVLIAATVILLVLAAGVAAGSATLARGVCDSCHEMEPKVSAWAVSPHAEVECYACHGSAAEWYDFPNSVVDRAARLGRFIRVHATGEHEAAIGQDVEPSSIPDSTCLECHDPARTGTSRMGVPIQHEKHARRNKSCVSCHLWTAHQDPAADRNLLMMQLCYKCHGQPDQPKASAACTTCHPKDLPLRPESHRKGDWRPRHGKLAKTDRQQCLMCHNQAFCDECHGLDMPHPLGWARGKSSHAVVARRARRVCEQCHAGKANLCTMCHHRGMDESKGTWVAQHFLAVHETGAAFCMKCHEGSFCVDCHTASGGPPDAPRTQ